MRANVTTIHLKCNAHAHLHTSAYILIYKYIYVCVRVCICIRGCHEQRKANFFYCGIFFAARFAAILFSHFFLFFFFIADGLNWFLADIKQLAKYYIFVWLGNTQTSLYVWGLYLNSCNRLWTEKSINRIYLINIYLLQCQQCLERVFMAYSILYTFYGSRKCLKNANLHFHLKYKLMYTHTNL